MLEEAYRQCNENLRATDTKRDQSLVFYVVVLGVLASASNLTEPARSLLASGVAILGFILVLVAIQYMRWHFIYIRSAQIITYLSFNNNKPPIKKKIIVEAWEKQGVLLKPAWTWESLGGQVLKIVEPLVFNVFVVLAAVAFQILLEWSGWGGLFRLPSVLAAFLLNLFVYFVVSNALAVFVLRNAFKDGWENWILNGLIDSDVSVGEHSIGASVESVQEEEA